MVSLPIRAYRSLRLAKTTIYAYRDGGSCATVFHLLDIHLLYKAPTFYPTLTDFVTLSILINDEKEEGRGRGMEGGLGCGILRLDKCSCFSKSGRWAAALKAYNGYGDQRKPHQFICT